MKWKFWEKKPELEIVIDSHEIPTSTLFRWFLYDSGASDPNKIATSVGYTAISSEGEEMELKESIERLREVEPYKSFLDLLSEITGQVMSHTLATVLTENDIVEEEIDKEQQAIMAEVYTRVANLALVPAFAAALKLGIIVNPGTFTGDIDEF
jgi:hypothetical protein